MTARRQGAESAEYGRRGHGSEGAFPVWEGRRFPQRVLDYVKQALQALQALDALEALETQIAPAPPSLLYAASYPILELWQE